MIKTILNASGGELLEALTEAADHMRKIEGKSIIIDGVDKLGREGAQLVQKLLAECLNSLRHHGTCYEKISKEHSGTFEWLWEHPKYKVWSDTSFSDVLLIEGQPGSGKCTVTKYIKNNLFEREPLAKQPTVASFFYSRREGELQTNHSNMLRSILHDVLHQNETFFFHFQSLYRNTQHGTPEWNNDSPKRILLSFKEHPAMERLYIIVDAMDESDDNDRRDIIHLLYQLRETKKLCIVKIKNIIKLQDENKPDILKFVESFLANLKLSPTYYCKVKDYIVRHAQAVFGWVHLVGQELLKYAETGCNNKEIHKFLQSLPKELDSFYKHILVKLEKNERRDIEVGLRVFQLILFAYCPLTVQEIQHALAIPDDIDTEYTPSAESFEENMIYDIVKGIIHCGGNFLDIKGPHETIYFNLRIKLFSSSSHGFSYQKQPLYSG
ncbi:hypothetical protein BDD12DRAFT_893073 [Trichophaea hybrida]|nr:hypothetical protein BDD12DRAFT_893073 [Trichophaea hybrida]